ncbi:MAG TPA: hypothetical protein VGO86_07385 [Candidatus Dormibacteraeota bacterium]|jgi:hypothetical protein
MTGSRVLSSTRSLVAAGIAGILAAAACGNPQPAAHASTPRATSSTSPAAPSPGHGPCQGASPAPKGGVNPFSQTDIDAAVAADRLVFKAPTASSHPGTGPTRVYGAKVMYFLALVNCIAPNAASGGTTVAAALLKQVQSVIAGGTEPSASGDLEGWSHNGVAQALLLARQEPNVWNGLSAPDQAKVDDLMEALGIAGNWGFNDANDFRTGIGQFGNFKKTDNPNFREGYVGVEIAVIQYFGAARWDQMLGGFSYDAFTAKLQADGFTNIAGSWARAGKTLMENGGADKHGGSGTGVKMPFVYAGHHSSDLIGIYDALAKFTWSETVASTVSAAHVHDSTASPFEGQMGMEREFNSSDGSGMRSDALYAYEGFMNSLTTRTSMFVLGAWGCGKTQATIIHLESVGVGDLMYKLQHGYDGASTRTKQAIELVNESTPASDGPNAKGYQFDKDNWLNYTSTLNSAC